MSWIDVHTHINMIEMEPKDIIAAAQSKNISHLITIGTGIDDHPKVVELVDKYSPVVYGTLGFHPHDAKDYSEAGEKYMCEHFSNPRIVAVGEIGLDYFYNHSEHGVQKRVFRRQIELALEHNLPIEVHTRDAEKDTIEIIHSFGGRVRGLLHCFTGTQWLADEALKLGFNISISGVVTFKNAEPLRNVVRSVPLDRLHIETDAPFLTPVPFRGKKNEPSMMIHTAQVVADLKGVSLEELEAVTTANAKRLFTRLSS